MNFNGWSLNGDVMQLLILPALAATERDAIESHFIAKFI